MKFFTPGGWKRAAGLALFVLGMIFVHAHAYAQVPAAPYLVKAACLPASDRTSLTASPPYIDANSVGVCVRWYCYGEVIVPRLETFCVTWATLHLVGARIQTIQKAADPLKSLQDAGKRYTIVPLTDPSMQGMPP